LLRIRFGDEVIYDYEGDLRYDEDLIGRIFLDYLGFESLNFRRKVCIENLEYLKF